MTSEEAIGWMSMVANGEVDRATVENLKRCDPAAIRRVLSTYLPDEDVEALLVRLRTLLDEAEAQRSTRTHEARSQGDGQGSSWGA